MRFVRLVASTIFLVLFGPLCLCADIPGCIALTTDGRSFIETPRAISKTGKMALIRNVTDRKKQLVVMDLESREETPVDIPGVPLDPSWSPDGQILAYRWRSAYPGGRTSLCLYDIDNRACRVVAQSKSGYSHLTWSPSGDRLAVRKHEPDTKSVTISIFDVSSGKENEVNPTHSDSGNYYSAGAWSPDSTAFAFNSQVAKDAPYGLWICRADGSGLRLLTPSGCLLYAGSKIDWKDRGKWIVFSAHYNRDNEEDWLTDIWLIRPSGKDLRRVTNGASEDLLHRNSYGLFRCTPDERYAIARWYFPDPARPKLARGWAYVAMDTGTVIPAVATDISADIRDTESPYWEMSPDGQRFFCRWGESKLQGLGSESETKITTWLIAHVFDLRTRSHRELLRFQKDESPVSFFGWPSFSPDGRRVYFTLRVSKPAGGYVSDICYIDLGE